MLGLSEHRAVAGFYAVILHLVLLYIGPRPHASQDVKPTPFLDNFCVESSSPQPCKGICLLCFLLRQDDVERLA